MEAKFIEKKETAEGVFPYLDFGSEAHGRKSFRLWVNHRLIQVDENGKEVLPFPVRNAQILRTEKGSLVLKPGEGVVYDAFQRCGYRGDSTITVLAPQPALALDYAVYRSPLGSCGISRGMLVYLTEEKPLTVRWVRTGRTYGAPKQGIRIYHPDGQVDELDELPDGLESIEELKTELQ